MEAKRLLKNIDVQFISLVSAGANQKQILWKKDKAAENPTFQKTVKISKTDEEKRLVYGLVYAPGEVDTDGDTTTAEEIEKMAFAFMEKGRTINIDKQHDFEPDEGFVAESWILKENDPVFPDEKPGSWAVAIKVRDDETWNAVKAGDITGLSMAGVAEVEPVTKEKKDNPIVKFLRKVGVLKDFNTKIARVEFWQITDAFESAVREIFSEDFTGDRKAALLETIDQLRLYVDENVTIAKTEKAIDDIKKAYESLGKILKSTKMEAGEMAELTKEDVIKIVQETIAKSDSGGNAEPDKEKDAPDVADVIKSLTARVEELEKATPGKQSAKGQDVEKSGEPAEGFAWV